MVIHISVTREKENMSKMEFTSDASQDFHVIASIRVFLWGNFCRKLYNQQSYDFHINDFAELSQNEKIHKGWLLSWCCSVVCGQQNASFSEQKECNAVDKTVNVPKDFSGDTYGTPFCQTL